MQSGKFIEVILGQFISDGNNVDEERAELREDKQTANEYAHPLDGTNTLKATLPQSPNFYFDHVALQHGLHLHHHTSKSLPRQAPVLVQ
jgi:hypothetical protein